MKNLRKTLIVLFAFSLLVSCDRDMDNHVTGDATEGGALIKFSTDVTAIAAGMPLGTDLSTASVAFSETKLDITALLHLGGHDVTKYEIVKTFNGTSESVVATGSELPLNVTYTTIAEFLDGTGVADSATLRIGDQFKFKVKIYTNSGVFYSREIQVVNVGCSSSLAGNYHVTSNRPSDGASWDQGVEVISPKGTGVYKTGTTGGWAISTIAPDQGFDFEDLCNDLTVPNQDLAQAFYSNDVYQTEDQATASHVDPDTGNLHIEYTISFGSGDREYSNDYIKQ